MTDDPDQPQVLQTLRGYLRTGLATVFADIWSAVRAIEVVTAEVQRAFDNVEPLRPAKREALERMKARMLGLAKELAYLEVEITMPEPEEQFLALIRDMVGKDD